jgi:UDP-N-acetylglucosamine 2-epimerase
MSVALVVGTRPQIIKSAPVVHEAQRRRMELLVINTGQHYDTDMSTSFLRELRFPSGLINLGVRAGTECKQLASIVASVGNVLRKERPGIVLVPGDTNSALGAALAALKEHVPIAHLEAGARSFDPSLPEEMNRRLIDHCSAILFTPTALCTENLRKEGIRGPCVKTVGDTMYDLILSSMPRIRKALPSYIKLDAARKIATLTVHRQGTVDDKKSLTDLFEVLASLPEIEFVFVAHPRTRRRLKEFMLFSSVKRLRNVRMIKPLGYFETLSLVRRSNLVLTDSGGLQKEAFWLGVPCITLREKTEWMETVRLGTNVLTDIKKDKIMRAVKRFTSEDNKMTRSQLGSSPNPFGNGTAAFSVVEHLQRFLDAHIAEAKT